MTERAGWPDLTLAHRVQVVHRVARLLAERSDEFVAASMRTNRTDALPTIVGELMPLADAIKFLHRNARSILRSRRAGARGRPAWLFGVAAVMHRVPLGTVLVIGPGNYPLMLPGIQIAQALVAGNRVLFKPAPGASAVAKLLCQTFYDAGVPADALRLLDESPTSIDPWLAKVDKVVLTGSATTGKAVLARLAPLAIPAVMELSGVDAMFVLAGADLDRAAAAVVFGMTFNRSETCLAPRRIYVASTVGDELLARVKANLPTTLQGALSDVTRRRVEILTAEAEIVHHRDIDGVTILENKLPRCDAPDIMAPVCWILRFDTVDQAVESYNQCEYRLGASIFGPVDLAQKLAARVDAGSIAINDVIAPTVDPRLPFGGGKQSGFGLTRGVEGLLEMTRVKTVSTRTGKPLHLDPDSQYAGPLLATYLRAAHGPRGLKRLKNWLKVAREARRYLKRKKLANHVK